MHTACGFTRRLLSSRAPLCRSHKRDIPELTRICTTTLHARAPHHRRIYRTLMHNVLRDDGKYGYITHQRPMLFSLAPHWLMLIRNQRSRRRSQQRRPRSLRRALRSLSLLKRLLKDVMPTLMRTIVDLEKKLIPRNRSHCDNEAFFRPLSGRVGKNNLSNIKIDE